MLAVGPFSIGAASTTIQPYRIIHIRPRCQQDPGGCHIARSSGKHQRSESTLRATMNVGPVLYQDLGSLLMPLRHRPHQRRLSAPRFFHIRFRPVLQQQFPRVPRRRSAHTSSAR